MSCSEGGFQQTSSPVKLAQSLANSANKSLTTKMGAYTLTSTGLKQRTKKTITEESCRAREKRRIKLISK